MHRFHVNYRSTQRCLAKPCADLRKTAIQRFGLHDMCTWFPRFCIVNMSWFFKVWNVLEGNLGYFFEFVSESWNRLKNALSRFVRLSGNDNYSESVVSLATRVDSLCDSSLIHFIMNHSCLYIHLVLETFVCVITSFKSSFVEAFKN